MKKAVDVITKNTRLSKAGCEVIPRHGHNKQTKSISFNNNYKKQFIMSTDATISKGGISMNERYGLKITGNVEKIQDVEDSNGNSKQTVIIATLEDDPNHIQYIPVEFFGGAYDKVSEKLEKLNEGDLVEFGINLRGRKYTKRDGSGVGYFHSVSGWSVFAKAAATTTAAETSGNDNEDDLPF